MLLDDIAKESGGKFERPGWLNNNCGYLTITGSHAYGVNKPDSDIDVYGFALPPKEVLFPQSFGYIIGFDTNIPVFNQWQAQHVKHAGAEYDFTIFSLPRMLRLCLDNNPNMIDMLFTPRECVIHSTQAGERVRKDRKVFLHKGCVNKFIAYALSQMAKIKGKVNSTNPKRAEDIRLHGMDTKFAYHLVRLLWECGQIIRDGEINMAEPELRAALRGIREGEWSLDQLEAFRTEQEKRLTEALETSTLPDRPNTEQVRTILVDCLEAHYGNLQKVMRLASRNAGDALMRDVAAAVERYREAQ